MKLKKVTKLKQDDFEQGRVLERVSQTPLVLATYDMHNSVSQGSNGMSHGSDEMSHGRNDNSDA